MSDKPFAAAAEQNRDDILPVLKKLFAHATNVLEIGSGTGQHAVYFASVLNHLIWQTSDKPDMLAGIQLWLNDANLSNTPSAIALDVNSKWPNERYDAAYAANIMHIMHWQDIKALFTGLEQTLKMGAIFCVYGPFNINGQYTSDSNRDFDFWLKQRDAQSGLKDTLELDELASQHNFQATKRFALPANNMILSWKK